MAVLLASALLAASIFSLPADPYDNAGVESPDTAAAPVDATETAPEALKIDASDPHAYLYASYPRYARRLDCTITRESRWNPWAYNPRSGAEGLAQFISSTWYSTPQGKAGASRTDPIASIDASVFLIEKTPQSWRHWQVITSGLC